MVGRRCWGHFMAFRVWAGLAAGLVLAAPVYAAPQKATPKKPPIAAKPAVRPAAPPAPPTLWKPVAYPGGSGSLPANYKGEDAYNFFQVFNEAALKIKKDEFETTTAYQARIADVSALIAPIDPNSLYAFKIGTTSSYDADSQIFTVGYKNAYNCETPAYDLKEGSVFLCTVETHFSPSESYQGQNAYGATVAVKRIRGEKISVTVPRSMMVLADVFSKVDSIGNYSVIHTIPMPIEQASALRGKHLDVLFVGRIAGPTMVSGRIMSSKPTINDPTDMFVSQNGIPFEPTSVVFYVVETGQILETVKADYPTSESKLPAKQSRTP